MTADLVVLNGKVLTVHQAAPQVEAFAVSGGRITAVGTTRDIRALVGPSTQVIDVAGKVVTPGLIDTHIHVVSLGSMGAGAGLAFVGTESAINIGQARTVRHVLEIIANRIKRIAPGEWVLTSWPSGLQPGEELTCKILDQVSPVNPVMVTGYPRVIVNSYILRQAGITRETQAPPGGEVGRDAVTGEPNGVFAFQAIYKLLPKPPQPSVAGTEDALKRVQAEFVREGLTTYKDAGLRDHAFEAYRNLQRRGELQCRTEMMHAWIWSAQEARDLVERYKAGGDDQLHSRSVKLSVDGSVPTGTAWSYEDWSHDIAPAGTRGYTKIEPDELNSIVDILHSAGWQVSCHCGGDRAIDAYLTAVEGALKRTPRQNCRHTIIHCELPSDQAIDRIAALGDNIGVETQSSWMLSGVFARACGPERSKRFMPLKTLLRKGVTVGNGCDFPVSNYPPRFGLSAACTRRPITDVFGQRPYGSDECLTFSEALHTYTLGAAKCLFWDHLLGSIEPGKLADFVVWNQDLPAIPLEELSKISPCLTAVGGKLVYSQATV